MTFQLMLHQEMSRNELTCFGNFYIATQNFYTNFLNSVQCHYQFSASTVLDTNETTVSGHIGDNYSLKFIDQSKFSLYNRRTNFDLVTDVELPSLGETFNF